MFGFLSSRLGLGRGARGEPPRADGPQAPRPEGWRPAGSPAVVAEVNGLLDWHAGTNLGGMLLGRLGVKPGKRTKCAAVPDRRIVELDRRLPLRGRSVLELGCFEGIHTLGLRLFSDDVTAVDVRPSNVLKTLARLSWHGTWAKVFPADAETLDRSFGTFDVVFHCGVLYHLALPVEHLARIGTMCPALFLDTHVSRDEGRLETREAGGFRYRGAPHAEGGWADPFSGKGAVGFWLTEGSLLEALGRAGFTKVEVLERRAERNGPRLALLALKDGA